MDERRPNIVETTGAAALSLLRYAGGMTVLLGQAMRWTLLGMFTRRVRLGRHALAAQMVRVGVRSLGIVILVQVFIGVILALQMTPPLAQWKQESQVAVIIGLAGFRMLGPIITAIVLSGFAGASIAAEIGSMVVSEEVEALEAHALNPVRFLVVPRLLATVVMTVLLTVIADWMIAAGGYAASRVIVGEDIYAHYWTNMRDSLVMRDFVIGLTQAAVFGLLIGLIACYEGLKVRGGPEGVGKATTMTVVYSIVSIIAAACVFTVLFYVAEQNGWI
jgi:phospholipid/cholesterol/gamma-HCH transport system permease protein